VITIHQRYRQTDGQTDRQTDRQTTCDRNTALCTKVHRAVITTEDKNLETQCSAVKRKTSLSLALCDMAMSSPAAISK